MILGLSLHAFTVLHVIISLVAIFSGLVVLYGMFYSQRMPALTAFFLVTTLLTSLTGFAFPATSVTPAQVVGYVSLLLLAAAILALYAFHLTHAWRWIYVVTAVFALYLNVFVLVVQGFQKVPSLHALAPTGSERPFIIAQTVVLLAFLALGSFAVRRFHPKAIIPRA
jgi:hypothetical protein